MSNENTKQVGPTKGFHVKTFEKEGLKMTFWDLGGQRSIRGVWENYYEANDAIVNFYLINQVFVIDSSDQYRIQESGKELQKVLEVYL
jgi:GTPase SAR1 family protein